MNKKKCRKDYSPQNHPSKYISCRCPSFKLEWVQRHSCVWSHKPDKHGRTRVAGIVSISKIIPIFVANLRKYDGEGTL